MLFRSEGNDAALTPKMKLMSPAMLPERASPNLQAEDGLRVLTPLNVGFASMASITPTMKPNRFVPPYSPEAMRYIQTGVFGSSHENNHSS